MKKWLTVCCALLLASCIDVDDFGQYWEKTTVDPALAGHWAKVSFEDEDKTTGQEWTFTKKNDAYEVQTHVAGKTDDEEPLYPVKTLKVGKYKFLGNGPDKGNIVRYEIDDNIAEWDVLDPEAAWKFIQKNYPEQKNIYREEFEEDVSPEVAADRPLKIEVFTDEVYKILSAIPDTDEFWDADTILKKIR